MVIYVGFESPSIIKHLEPTTGDLFTARFADCHFNELVFPSVEYAPEWIEIPSDNKAIENESVARRKPDRPPGS